VAGLVGPIGHQQSLQPSAISTFSAMCPSDGMLWPRSSNAMPCRVQRGQLVAPGPAAHRELLLSLIPEQIKLVVDEPEWCKEALQAALYRIRNINSSCSMRLLQHPAVDAVAASSSTLPATMDCCQAEELSRAAVHQLLQEVQEAGGLLQLTASSAPAGPRRRWTAPAALREVMLVDVVCHAGQSIEQLQQEVMSQLDARPRKTMQQNAAKTVQLARLAKQRYAAKTSAAKAAAQARAAAAAGQTGAVDAAGPEEALPEAVEGGRPPDVHHGRGGGGQGLLGVGLLAWPAAVPWDPQAPASTTATPVSSTGPALAATGKGGWQGTHSASPGSLRLPQAASGSLEPALGPVPTVDGAAADPVTATCNQLLSVTRLMESTTRVAGGAQRQQQQQQRQRRGNNSMGITC